MLINKHIPNGTSDSEGAIAQIDVACESVNLHDRQTDDRTRRVPTQNIGMFQPSEQFKKLLISENGMTITTVSPVTRRCSFFSVASFDPRRIPKAIINENLQVNCSDVCLMVEDYMAAVEKLINDSRFRVYCICHQRIVLMWMLCSFILMLLLLVSGARGIGLFALIVAWMILVCIGVAICKNIAVCVAAVNKFLSPFDLLLCVDDRGRFSCNKITIVFVRFNLRNCIVSSAFICKRLNVSSISANVDMSTEQIRMEQAKRLLFRYSQQYCRDLVRGVVRFPPTGRSTERSDFLLPLHCAFAQCLCQYVERNFFFRKERSRWISLYT
ncbi:hypothetical protein TTRE_0000039301 [Trichuris trichiura]|uniref:Uncharacterized protein n=1 Tax=Trichuris trichiura TaxID=36087 RepID=A0A077YWS3_TRITR|nr:hypothetical protein TTRE_0000039301 [Trichuris trichiura]